MTNPPGLRGRTRDELSAEDAGPVFHGGFPKAREYLAAACLGWEYLGAPVSTPQQRVGDLSSDKVVSFRQTIFANFEGLSSRT